MKKCILLLFVFQFLIVSCVKSNEFEDIDWLYDMRFLTVDELKSKINLNFVTNWSVGDQEGWTYNFSNNDFDYEYRFRFTRNRLNNIETIITPVNISPQELNQKLRQHIARKFNLQSFSNIIPEHGLELKVENLLINGMRFEITFRNRQFPPALFGKWEFNFEEKTNEHIKNNIAPHFDFSRYWFISHEVGLIMQYLDSLDTSHIWEINGTNVIFNSPNYSVEYQYDINQNEITLFSHNGIKITKFNYEVNRNNRIRLFGNGELFWERINLERESEAIWVGGTNFEPIEEIRDETILNIIGNKIE